MIQCNNFPHLRIQTFALHMTTNVTQTYPATPRKMDEGKLPILYPL